MADKTNKNTMTNKIAAIKNARILVKIAKNSAYIVGLLGFRAVLLGESSVELLGESSVELSMNFGSCNR
jgi:hypothetical protein